MTKTQVTSQRSAMLTALRKFARSRPGLDFRNYVSSLNDHEGIRNYMSESRAITKMLEHARILINAVEWREAGIKAEDIIEAGRLSYGGRLTWSEQRQDWDYCTGSYYPVEYRKAVCSVMAMCLIQYWFRDGFKASEMHSKAVIEFGKSIANRWFK